jgi:hypothetical protein
LRGLTDAGLNLLCLLNYAPEHGLRDANPDSRNGLPKRVRTFPTFSGWSLGPDTLKCISARTHLPPNCRQVWNGRSACLGTLDGPAAKSTNLAHERNSFLIDLATDVLDAGAVLSR